MRNVVIATLFVLFAACVAPTTAERIPEILTQEGVPTSGEQLWTDHCSGCHGLDGTGGTELGLVGTTRSEETILTAVIEGQHDMPAFGDELSDAELAHLLAYLDETLGLVGEDEAGGHEH